MLEIIKAFNKKYKGVDYSLLHILKSLIYFEDADKEAMPKMLKAVKWGEVKEFFKNQVLALKKELEF